MKGKTQKGVKVSDKAPKTFYAGASSKVAAEAGNKAEGFKKGGKVKKHAGKIDGVMSAAHAGRKPRKSVCLSCCPSLRPAILWT